MCNVTYSLLRNHNHLIIAAYSSPYSPRFSSGRLQVCNVFKMWPFKCLCPCIKFKKSFCQLKSYSNDDQIRYSVIDDYCSATENHKTVNYRTSISHFIHIYDLALHEI